jgi:hypothetical protein
MHPGFQCSSVLQEKWRTFWACSTLTVLHQGRRFWSVYLPCRKRSTNRRHTMSHWMRGFCFWDLLPTQSRRAKIKKPCGRTTQFSVDLYCQARNQRRTELVKGYLWSRGSQYYLLSHSFLELFWLASEIQPRATDQLRASCFLHQLRSVELLNMSVGSNSIIRWRAPKILWAAPSWNQIIGRVWNTACRELAVYICDLHSCSSCR